MVPTFMAEVNRLVTHGTRAGGNSRLMMSGTTTLPTVRKTPSRAVPRMTAGSPPADRTTEATTAPARARVRARSGPRRRMVATASGAQSAKARTGMLVSSPTTPAATSRSAWMSRATGATATIGERSTAAVSTIVSATPHSDVVRARGGRTDIPPRLVRARVHPDPACPDPFPVSVRARTIGRDAYVRAQNVRGWTECPRPRTHRDRDRPAIPVSERRGRGRSPTG